MQTALDLLRNEITPYILADGVSSCNKQEISIALERLRQAGAVITTSESLLFQLVGTSSSGAFPLLSVSMPRLTVSRGRFGSWIQAFRQPHQRGEGDDLESISDIVGLPREQVVDLMILYAEKRNAVV